MAETLSIRDTARRKDAPWLTLRMREAMEAWLFISPTLAGFLIFFVGPLIAVVWYSLTELTFGSLPGCPSGTYLITRRYLSVSSRVPNSPSTLSTPRSL